MAQVLEAYPGARRALFRRYHIGGCSSCGFEPIETLANLCGRKELDVSEVVSYIQSSHEADKELEISPKEVAERRTRGDKVLLLDIRSREEWEAARIHGAEFMEQALVQQLMAHPDPESLLVIYDHGGKQSLDAVAYFAGHGFNNARYLRGGIDAWSQEVDPTVPRYRLEADSGDRPAASSNLSGVILENPSGVVFES